MEAVFMKGFTDGFTKEAARPGGISALKAQFGKAKKKVEAAAERKEEKAEKKGMASLKAKLFKGAEAETETSEGLSFKDYLREKYLSQEVEEPSNLFEAWKTSLAAKRGKAPPPPMKPGLSALAKLKAMTKAQG